MTDALSDYIVEQTRCNTPFLLKYIPYGALSEVRGCYVGLHKLLRLPGQVMPYLSRRAIENKSVLGNGAAVEERKRAGELIRKKLFG